MNYLKKTIKFAFSSKKDEKNLLKNTFLRNVCLLLLLFVTVTLAGCKDNNSPIESNNPSFSTKYITISYFNWNKVIYEDGTWAYGHWYCRYDIPAINDKVLENGAVLVYYYDNVNDNWILLSYTTTLSNDKNELFTEEIWFGYSYGRLDIDFVRSDLLDPPDMNLKVVIFHD